jgi:hypothetical protein
VRCRTAELALSIFSELEHKSPFLAIDLEARPAPLPMMASWGDHDKRPCSGNPNDNNRWPSSCRARTGASSSRASPSVRWGFSMCQRLPGLAALCDVGLCLLIGAGFLLLWTWWPRWRLPSSCKSNSLPKRGSWIAAKVPSLRGKTVSWLPSAF